MSATVKPETAPLTTPFTVRFLEGQSAVQNPTAHEVLKFNDEQVRKVYKVTSVGRFIQVSHEDDLQPVPTPVLLAIYNKYIVRIKGQPLSRFRDRETAQRRVFEILGHYATVYVPPVKEQSVDASQKTAAQGRVKRTPEEIAQANADKANAKAKKEADQKAKKEAKEAQKQNRAPGIISTIQGFLESDEGGTIEEIHTKLVQSFPDRDPDGMKSTVRIQVSRLKAKIGEIDSKMIVGRGRVYKATNNGPIPGVEQVKAAPAAPAAPVGTVESVATGKAPKATKAAA